LVARRACKTGEKGSLKCSGGGSLVVVLGAAKSRQETHPPDHARDLRDMVLKDHEGRDVRVGDLWRGSPAVLVFLRYYGCTFCRAHVVALNRARERFEDVGVRLAAIAQGTPEDAAQFRKKRKIEFPVLVDPERATYEAAGAKIAVLSEIMGPRVLGRGVKRAIKSRVLPGRMRGHVGQLGGVLVVAPDGSIRYAHLSRDASDNPPTDEVLAAARAIRPHLRGFPAAASDGDAPALAATDLADVGEDDQEAPPEEESSGAALRGWTPRELGTFLEHAYEDRLYALWLLLVTTGLWPDEALALKWSDVDLGDGRISVRTALIPVGEAVGWSELEVGRGRRDISLDPPTITALRIHQRTQLVAPVAFGPGYRQSGLVFTREDGSVLHPEEVSRLFDDLVDSAGVPNIRLIDLRHTHATLALQAGVPPEVVSQRLGHGSVARTVEAYAHAIPTDEELERHLATLAEER
jgi:integrase/peroxiredoxin